MRASARLGPCGGTLLSYRSYGGGRVPAILVSDSRPQARSSCAARRCRRAVCDDADHSLVAAARRDGRRDLQSGGRRSRATRTDWRRGRASRFAALRAVSRAAVAARGLGRVRFAAPAVDARLVAGASTAAIHPLSSRIVRPARPPPRNSLTRFAVRRIVSWRVSVPVPTHRDPRT